MFDTVLGNDASHPSRLCSGTIISVATHAVILGAILWISSRPAAIESARLIADPKMIIFDGSRGGGGAVAKILNSATDAATPRTHPRRARPLVVAPSKESATLPQARESDLNDVGQPSGTGPDAHPGIGRDSGPGSKDGPGSSSSSKDSPARIVPSFVFDRELLAAPDPHLPSLFKDQHPHQQLRGQYRICVGMDGRVQQIGVLSSIPGADHAIIEQVKNTWRYRPQPVPVCTVRSFIFSIN